MFKLWNYYIKIIFTQNQCSHSRSNFKVRPETPNVPNSFTVQTYQNSDEFRKFSDLYGPSDFFLRFRTLSHFCIFVRGVLDFGLELQFLFGIRVTLLTPMRTMLKTDHFTRTSTNFSTNQTSIQLKYIKRTTIVMYFPLSSSISSSLPSFSFSFALHSFDLLFLNFLNR